MHSTSMESIPRPFFVWPSACCCSLLLRLAGRWLMWILCSSVIIRVQYSKYVQCQSAAVVRNRNTDVCEGKLIMSLAMRSSDYVGLRVDA